MKGIEEIYFQKKLIAIVFRHSIKTHGIKFFTQDDNPFQVGLQYKKRGISLSPHMHILDKPLQVTSAQEVLIVQKGKIRVTLYTKNGEIISKKILKQNDYILLMYEGHGTEFLEDSQIFEIKQGPYSGLPPTKIPTQK